MEEGGGCRGASMNDNRGSKGEKVLRWLDCGVQREMRAG
jgi:hypothetical protein